MKKNKKQLHEALAVLLTKLSSARDNPLLMDNDHCDRIKPHRSSSETSLQDGLHIHQHFSSLSTCHGTSDLAKQGRRADLYLIKKQKENNQKRSLTIIR